MEKFAAIVNAPEFHNRQEMVDYFAKYCNISQQEWESSNVLSPRAQKVLNDIQELRFVQSLYNDIFPGALCSFNCISKEVEATRREILRQPVEAETLYELIYFMHENLRA